MFRLIPFGALAAAGVPFFDDNGMSLLQFRATRHVANISHASAGRALEDPGKVERAMCPHELEAEEAAEKAFGCEGTIKAPDTVMCSWWGDPHISEFFTGKPKSMYDILHTPGLFKLAAARDGSWEIQSFSCGIYAQSVAIRLGKTIVEMIGANGHWGQPGWHPTKFFVDGVEVRMPFQKGDVKLGSSSLRSYLNSGTIDRMRLSGTCVDYGDVSIDLTGSQHGKAGWVGLLIEAAAGTVTTFETDPHSVCNFQPPVEGDRRDGFPGLQEVPPEKSLFTRGSEICSSCSSHGQCQNLKKLEADAVRLESICRASNVPLGDAAAACDHLANNEEFFNDCQMDFCASGGDQSAAEEAEEEEARENPQPVCVGGGNDCNPGTACCNALRDQAKLVLDNVLTNNICGTEDADRQLRFGRALTQNGVAMDLVVSPVGEYECGKRMTNDNFGSKNAEIGLLAVAAGTEATFEFRFVKAGTAELVAPQSLMLTFMDIDQGKKNKQRESIKVCGGGAILTDDSELDVVEKDGCTTVMSTTHGTGRDNPSSVEGMSQMHRARSAAFSVQGDSFTAKLSVSKKGNNPRKFMFAGHPGVACVLK